MASQRWRHLALMSMPGLLSWPSFFFGNDLGAGFSPRHLVPISAFASNIPPFPPSEGRAPSKGFSGQTWGGETDREVVSADTASKRPLVGRTNDLILLAKHPLLSLGVPIG